MPKLISAPARIEAAGNLPKIIREYVGRVNTADPAVSVARMSSPPGWVEPGQRPEFRELVLRVEHEGGAVDVPAGQALITEPGEWIRYSTPTAGGAEYVAVCLPAFSPHTVHRDSP